ncbi:hypothetical protein ACFFUB_07075, partial [Algimonas porphyrae]|uniref:hypothetical protein n=1 Tax=Algimonas porphyrae TaxID=1128113 RepID=UPI0035E9496D
EAKIAKRRERWERMVATRPKPSPPWAEFLIGILHAARGKNSEAPRTLGADGRNAASQRKGAVLVRYESRQDIKLSPHFNDLS